MRGRELQLLGGIVALAALTRFATLDVQSYWYDEAVTVGLIRMDLGDMLAEIPNSESTPPLYYTLAWLWAKLFGTGEVGLRSFSALAGTACIPVVYAAATRLASIRAGLIAASLAAVSPLLVWYSQEARAYSLLVLLCGLSFLFFARLLTGDARQRIVVAWAVVSALALTTHYFAAFLVAIEAIWLLASAANRRPIAIATATVAAVGMALLPLLLHQRSLGFADFIRTMDLDYRLAETPKQFLIGADAPGAWVSAVVAGLLVLAAPWLTLTRAGDSERRAALIGYGVGGAVLGIVAVLAIAGADYLYSRNLLVVWPALAVAVAAGFGARRSGPLGLGAAFALMALFAVTIGFVAASAVYQRDDWRGVAGALGEPEAGPQAVVAAPGSAVVPLRVYEPGLEVMTEETGVAEIVVVGVLQRGGALSTPDPPVRPDPPPPPPLPGFELAETRFEDSFTLLRYTAAAPVTIGPEALVPANLEPDEPPAVLVRR